MFFVQGIAEKDLVFDPQFEVIQDGKTFPGEAICQPEEPPDRTHGQRNPDLGIGPAEPED